MSACESLDENIIPKLEPSENDYRAAIGTRVRVHVLAHTLWELDRTGVKASILTDCVGQLRLIESTQPPIEFPQGMGEYARPYTWGFCHRLPYAGRRHSSKVSSFRVDPCDRWLLKSLCCRQHRPYGYFLPQSIDFF